ncbi:MAG: hypothetical protein H7222_03660 [Methylotenera sp.]|nr:hypothetical protein [Oligoflexia bacterium]
MQWFHPDERQLLEFAHFHAHHRLHPFLESTLHLRNQTLPWLFSLLVRACDLFQSGSPRRVLFVFHVLIGTCSWITLALLTENFRKSHPQQDDLADSLGWTFALLWVFPWIYSRGLLEAVSFIPAGLLYLALQNDSLGMAGFWAGCTSILRYPSALWSLGAAWIHVWKRTSRKTPLSAIFKSLLISLFRPSLGFLLAIALGGIADYFTYGSFLKSAPAYWNFNRPHGPVAQTFGADSLWVYYRWFEYALTPWVAPVFIIIAIHALLKNRLLLFFTLPYLLGHVWTPHREPRFMIPLLPFLILAIFQSIARDDFSFIRIAVRKWPRLVASLVALHLAVNFCLYPLQGWAQWNSAQGVLLRSFNFLKASPRLLITRADPLMDAIVPALLPWSDSQCRLHREMREPFLPEPFYLFSKERPASCAPLTDLTSHLHSMTYERWLRVRTASLWLCPAEELKTICPTGLKAAPQGEPFTGRKL